MSSFYGNGGYSSGGGGGSGDAQNFATQAGQSASQALTYKTASESARDEAQSIVNSISANASQINTNTESIASLEEDRYKPYVTDSTSGTVVSFTDGADDIPLKSLVVNIDPVQDLHGYDSPWVGGTGINLLKPVETTVTSNGIVATGYEDGKVTVTGTATSDVQVELFLISVTEKRYYLILKNDISGSADTWWVSISGVAPIYSGHVNSANFYSAGNYKLRINVKSGITINQTFYPMIAESETTYSPYENICPISGWDAVNVGTSGKNLYNPVTALLNTWINTDTGEIVSGANGFWTSDYIPVKPSTTYVKVNVGSSRGSWYDANKTFIGRTDWTADAKTAPTNARYVRFCGQTSTIAYDGQVQFEEGATATPYEPYTGRSINISLGQTVYGGSLDVLSGVLTVDRAMVDMGTLTWTKDENRSGNFYTGSISNIARSNSAIMCSSYAVNNTYGAANIPDGILSSMASYGGRRVFVKDTTKANLTASEFKSAMDGVQLVYELATPTTVQLTPHEVRSLLGQNNIFADTGDTEAVYRADTKLYIERLTEPDADMVADSNIVSGQYFMVGNTLYKATANIANGGQIIVGTNCTRVSLATALNEINA